MDLRKFQTKSFAGLFNRLGNLSYLGIYIQVRIRINISYAVAASEIQFISRVAQLVAAFSHELEHDHSCPFEHVLGEYLGSHMAVETFKLDVRILQGLSDYLQGLTCLNGRTEFGVHLTGSVRLKGMRIYTGCEPEKHLLFDTPSACFRFYGLDFLDIVSNEISYAVIHRKGNILIRLIVGVEICFFQIEAGLVCRVYLSGRYDVYAHTLFSHYLIDTLEAVGLGRIERDRSFIEIFHEGILIRSALLPYLIFVHQIHRCAVFLCQFNGILSCEQEMSVF